MSLSFTVKDTRGRHVSGLKPADLRLFEDGIAQTISTFQEGTGPSVKASFTLKVREEDAEGAYTLIYHPKPNPNTTYRTLKIQILAKGADSWTTKYAQGYWADSPDQ